MHAERQADLGHTLQHRHRLVHVAYTAMGIRRGAGGIELDGGDKAAGLAGLDIIGIRMLG